MGSILGRESEEITRLESLIREAVEAESDQMLRTTLRGLFGQVDAARERYWHRARQLHQLRENLKLSG
jgi:hypothetical protein